MTLNANDFQKQWVFAVQILLKSTQLLLQYLIFIQYEKKLIIGIMFFKQQFTSSTMQNASQKQETTPSLSCQQQFYPNSFPQSLQTISSLLDFEIQKCGQIIISFEDFVNKYKQQKQQIQNLYQMMKQAKKKQGFRKNQQLQYIQYMKGTQKIVKFSPLIVPKQV